VPEALVDVTQERGAPSIAFTYTEPLVTYEYVRDTSETARAKGIRNVLVTAGYINERPLRELCRTIDAVTLDVKSFDDEFYRKVTGGKLHPVLKTLTTLREEGVWLEVSYLMVTELSDDPSGVGRFAKWVVRELGEDTPLHLLRFHPQHKLRNLAPTPVGLMQQGRDWARESGLRHVYLGNLPGGEGGTTRCPHDGTVLIERRGFEVISNRLVDGACPSCRRKLAGVFG
jgi:pyruvate formate lyase activating enzyme